MSATIDGRPIGVAPGQTILDAARAAGVPIPTLCYLDRLPPEGGCRVCLVEVGPYDFAAACHTPVRDGMTIVTDSDRLRDLRAGVLALMAGEHGEGCFTPSSIGSEFERLLAGLHVNESPLFLESQINLFHAESSHPYLRFRADRCIVCRRCVHACESIQGQFVYAIGGRSAATHLIFGEHNRFVETDCTACGACVDVCPTHALTDADRLAQGPVVRTVRTTCGYCGVGCQVDASVSGDVVASIQGAPGAAVNRGHLCAKGRYAHGYHRAPDRLKRPLLRRGNDFEEVSWHSAVAFIAERLTDIRRKFGPDSIGALASSRSTNEAAFLLQKFARSVIGTDNIDCCARVCHSSTAVALRRVTGTGAATASFADIERAQCIVVAGANPTEAHPVLGARIKQAALRGVPLIVIDPRFIELSEYASVQLQIHPATNVAVFNAVAKQLIESGAIDARYVADRTEGFDELREFLAAQSFDHLSGVAGISVEKVRATAAVFAASKQALFVHGLGLSELTQGTESVIALCNLAMLTGSIGRPGAGMLPLRGQNNVQGAADMGASPALVTGYQRIDDPSVRVRVASLWGRDLPANVGLTSTEMLDAATEGRIRALWLQGEDVAHSDPFESRTLKALQSLELLIVQDPFFNETARYAHVVLPATTTLENDGTYTNGERRIQRVRPAVASPGDARQDWMINRDIANALGANWSYANPADVMDEIAAIAPDLFGGVAYDRLDDDGIQWPCPNRSHPGTDTLHADTFLRGKGRLSCIDYRPSPEKTSDEYPFQLITGRVLQQYNVGTMTRRTSNADLAPCDDLEMNPEDARLLRIDDGSIVEVRSRWGSTRIAARVTPRVARGTLFASFHYPESHVNRLIGPHVDPHSKCPEYKLAAVRVDRVA